jgi:hypothetical protein
MSNCAARNEQCSAQRAVRRARSGGATCDTTGAHESHEQLCGETNVAAFFAGEPSPLGDGFSVDVTDDANGFRRIFRHSSRGSNIKVFPQPKIGSRALNRSRVLNGSGVVHLGQENQTRWVVFSYGGYGRPERN